MKNTKDNSCTANTLDWNPLADLTDTGDIAEAASPFLETQEYASHTEYDALNRPISLTTPDGSVNLPTYNEAGLLDKVQACLRGASVDDTTPFVTNINYDAKGQRELVEYANGVYTEYTYDPLTFRVIRIRTIRTKDNACLQDLNYTYDPVGNITEFLDNAQKTIFYDNARVEPVNSYEYDALYRLICAEGREHAGQDANAQPGHHNPPIINTPHPNDAQAMRNYTEDYVYDEVGNILCMDHNFSNGGWKRNYQYENVSNRLESTSLPGDDPEGPYGAKYGYDAHGNMTGMPHLQEMCWDFKNQMCQVDLDGGGTACYIYDAGGQRARKVHEHNGSTVEERIYLGGYEIYRKHNGTGLTLERETLHIMDDQQRIALLETKTVEDWSEVLKPKALVQYQLNNHLGSSSLELDGEARVISYEEYYPYGSTSYQAVDKEIKAVAKRYRYTGKERDDETGLYYYGARYYAAWLGRWTSCDPIGIKDSLNIFQFVKGNPIKYFDNVGYESEEKATQEDLIEIAPRIGSELSVAGIKPGGTSKNKFQSSSKEAAITIGVGSQAIRNNPKGPTLPVPDEFEDPKMKTYKKGVRNREVGVNPDPKATRGTKIQGDAVKDFKSATSKPNYASPGTGKWNVGHKGVDLQHDLTGRSGTQSGGLAWEPESLNKSLGSKARHLKGGLPVGTPVGGVARVRDINKFWNRQGFRTGMRWGGGGLLGAGTILSIDSFGKDIEEGNWFNASLSGTGFAGGALEIGGWAANSTRLVTAGRFIGAPGAVIGAGVLGWQIGTYTNENTGIQDTAMSIGDFAHGLSGNVYVGATFAATGAIVTSPYYLAEAGVGALGDLGGWIGRGIYDLFH